MFTVTMFSYIEVLFLKFCSYRGEKVLVNRGLLCKGSTAVHLYMGKGGGGGRGGGGGTLSYLFFLDQTVKLA